MAIEEISRLVAQRLLQGCMNHEQFANYYDFLGLKGYKKCHEYHFFEQMSNYRKFITYYIEHENRLIPDFSAKTLTSFSIVPDNWYGYTREDVDINTKRNAVKSGLEKYVNWQKETKKFLQEMYNQSIQEGQISLAIKIQEYICSVDQEIKKASKEYLEIKATDYDLPTIVTKQQSLAKKYGKKIHEMRKEFDHVKSQRS